MIFKNEIINLIGPRRDGEGIEMKIQGILNNIELHDKCVMEITLLVAGFIIGIYVLELF